MRKPYEREKRRHTRRGEDPVTTEQTLLSDASTNQGTAGVARGHRSWRRACKCLFLKASRTKQSCPHLDFTLPVSRTLERVNFCWFKLPSLSHSFQQPQEPIQCLFLRKEVCSCHRITRQITGETHNSTKSGTPRPRARPQEQGITGPRCLPGLSEVLYTHY